MIAKYKVPVVIGTTVWLAACAQPPRAYYQPPPVYYVPTYAARPVPRIYAGPSPEIVPAKPEPPKTEPPKTETARQETTPLPRVSSPPFAPRAECQGWWRICSFL